MSIEEQLVLLIGLQKLDGEIYRLRRDLAQHPVTIATLEAAFKQGEVDLKKADDDAKTAAVRKKELELDLEAKEAGIKKLQTQLFQLKTNKEYQAMQKEIESQKADVSLIEEGILQVFDRIDACGKEIVRQKEILEGRRQKFVAEKQTIEAQARQIDERLAGLIAERTTRAQKVDKEYLSRYERILASKDGVAMVPVEGDTCGGCNINLPAQVINEIRLKEELIFCGSCARILYTE
ncbi:MAG: C4-type zinc ribbon domain-containing protein [Candidatus Omnitrophota bacterium]